MSQFVNLTEILLNSQTFFPYPNQPGTINLCSSNVISLLNSKYLFPLLFHCIFRSFNKHMTTLQSTLRLRPMEFLMINRNKLIQSSRVAFNRFRPQDWETNIKISFINEEAFDAGGPLREFLTLFYRETSSISLGNLTTYSDCIAKKDYVLLGRLIALGCIAGHPGPQCFPAIIVDYILNNTIPDVTEEDAVNASLKQAIKEVILIILKILI